MAKQSLTGLTALFCAFCKGTLTSLAAQNIGHHPTCLLKYKREPRFFSCQKKLLLEPLFDFERDLTWEKTSGGLRVNVPQLVCHHSPAGFEIGYSGAGPADLALNVLELFLPHRPLTSNERRYGVGIEEPPQFITADFEREPVKCWREFYCSRFAWQRHQAFKFDFLAHVPSKAQSGTINADIIRKWCQAHLASLVAENEKTFFGDLQPVSLAEKEVL